MLIAEPLQKAIDELSKLPAIGKKTAQRLAIHILKSDEETVHSLVNALMELKSKIRFCSECFNIAVDELCDVCKNPKRDRSQVCVVEEASDVIAIEKTNEFNGLYHVLGGVLNPLSGVTAESLHFKELLERLKGGEIKEIILALNPDAEGDATSLYISKLLKEYPVKISRIARGLPIGGDLEFADAATIGRAFIGRISLCFRNKLLWKKTGLKIGLLPKTILKFTITAIQKMRRIYPTSSLKILIQNQMI